MMSARSWKIGDRVFDLSRRGMIMGVLNVTPDSFSDGGQFPDVESAISHAMAMTGEGADMIDVGGESTRPGAEPISAREELARVIPVIARLRASTTVPLSIDTSKASVAEAAVRAGATIVNDVTAGRADPKMLPLVARENVALVLMHMQGEPRTMQKAPRYENVVREVADFFRQQYACAIECGVDPMAMALDPGIGFGKTLEHNLALLGNLEKLRVHDRPLVVGVSRKGFLGKLIGSSEMSQRKAPTIALTALLRARGGDVFRVHDVAENVHALRVSEAILPQG
jgi:dihydropteroate synthase